MASLWEGMCAAGFVVERGDFLDVTLPSLMTHFQDVCRRNAAECSYDGGRQGGPPSGGRERQYARTSSRT